MIILTAPQNLIPEVEENDTLGPCGCIDYHMADCDLMTGGGFAFHGYDSFYDENDPYYNYPD